MTMKLKHALNFWYSSEKKDLPLIVEFTYDYSAINKKKRKKQNKNNKKTKT